MNKAPKKGTQEERKLETKQGRKEQTSKER
jgi:hypothetical protein